jgi:hypothetical protein
VVGDRQRKVMPSEVTDHVSWFDRFAGVVAATTGRAWFFASCVALIAVWAPSIVVIRDTNTWQLIINTVTTCVTFLLVALLQNSTARSGQAEQHKLNAIADGLADLMDINLTVLAAAGADPGAADRLRVSIHELRSAVGLEHRESS